MNLEIKILKILINLQFLSLFIFKLRYLLYEK